VLANAGAASMHAAGWADGAQRAAQAQPQPHGGTGGPPAHGAATPPRRGATPGANAGHPAPAGSTATPAAGSAQSPGGASTTAGSATPPGTSATAPAPRTPPPRPRNIPAYSPPIEPTQGGPSLDAPTFGLYAVSEIAATDDLTGAFGVGPQVFLARNALGISRVAGGPAADFRSHDLAMQHRALSLATDSASQVWLVTDDGSAVRYDGNRFARVAVDNDANVVPLMFWSRGTNAAAVARVGHNQLRVYRGDGGRWQAVTDRPIDMGGPGTVDVKFLAVDASGRYWVGIRVANEGQTRELGVAVIDNNLPVATQFNSHVAPTGAEQGAVPAPDDLTAIEFDASGTAWFAGLSGCTSIQMPQTPGGSATVHTYNESNGLRGDLVSDIAKGPGDRIFLATTEGLGVRTPQAFDFGIEGSSAAPRAIALAVDVNGSLWGAGPRGAWVYDGQHFRTIGRGNGLASEAFTDVAVDGENRVWFVTDEGISVLAQPRTGVVESGGGT
jgi:hypothetical protein